MKPICRLSTFALCILFASSAMAQTAGPRVGAAQTGPAATPVTENTSKWVDLTHTFDASTIYWPTEAGFRLSVDKFGRTERGYFYAANSFAAAEHGGTHLDAPIHFAEQGQTVDQLPLDRLIGTTAVIDVQEACGQDADYLVSVNDLRAWELQHQRQLVNVILLIHTGYGKRWPDRQRYLGTDQLGADAVQSLHFPGLDPLAAKWLCEHRSVKAVGIDTASIDRGQSTHFESHVRLFKHNIPVFENVANLHLLPAFGANVIALPMKIGSGSGAPLRIVAFIALRPDPQP